MQDIIVLPWFGPEPAWLIALIGGVVLLVVVLAIALRGAAEGARSSGVRTRIWRSSGNGSRIGGASDGR
ncbi:MAG: hypothetical protein ACJ8F3_07950 [Xanthobacteraceae bacterium]